MIFLITKVVNYKASKRFYYISSVSNPKEFPISILGIWFKLENGEFVSRSFYKDEEVINSFYSHWGKSEYYESLEPEFLPKSLFIEYVDFRTKNYYLDTIFLPKEKMIDVFKNAKKNSLTKNLNSWKAKMGLEYHVGIANDGNIIFWLIGKNYESEFYRFKLCPKSFPHIIQATTQKVNDKNMFLKNLFEGMEDSIKSELLNKKNTSVHYKDSIPVYFDNLQQ